MPAVPAAAAVLTRFERQIAGAITAGVASLQTQQDQSRAGLPDLVPKAALALAIAGSFLLVCVPRVCAPPRGREPYLCVRAGRNGAKCLHV